MRDPMVDTAGRATCLPRTRTGSRRPGDSPLPDDSKWDGSVRTLFPQPSMLIWSSFERR